MSGSVMLSGSSLATRPGEMTVPAGEIATTTYRFTEAGELIIGCHLPGHYAYGMRALVRVG